MAVVWLILAVGLMAYGYQQDEKMYMVGAMVCSGIAMRWTVFAFDKIGTVINGLVILVAIVSFLAMGIGRDYSSKTSASVVRQQPERKPKRITQFSPCTDPHITQSKDLVDCVKTSFIKGDIIVFQGRKGFCVATSKRNAFVLDSRKDVMTVLWTARWAGTAVFYNQKPDTKVFGRGCRRK